MAAPSLSALPDSLLLQILACLPPRDRLGGARVCRRWHRLVRDKLLWRHLDLTSYKNFLQTRTRNERYWIGLHDKHTEGEWKWLDGSNYRTGFTNWKTGEPNTYLGRDEDCGQLWINGEWNDYTCSSNSYYVCEKPLPSKPTTAPKRT